MLGRSVKRNEGRPSPDLMRTRKTPKQRLEKWDTGSQSSGESMDFSTQRCLDEIGEEYCMSVKAESMEGTKGWHVAVGEPNRDWNIGAMACLAYILSFLVQIPRSADKS